MTMRLRVLGAALAPLLLAGCNATAAAAPTAPVASTIAAEKPKPGDSTPWDLPAVCAAESEISTLVLWRKQQEEAGRLPGTRSAAVLQGIAVQYLELDQSGLPASVRKDAAALAGAAGTLEHPSIDLGAKPVESARNDLHQVCSDHGLTIGVLAQGG